MGLDELLNAKKDEILRVAASHGAFNVRVFGSVVHGESGPDSDVDLLVELAPGRSLLDHVGLVQDLRRLLGREVDVVVEGGISPYLRDEILTEAAPL